MRGTYTATYLDRVAATFAKRRGVAALDIGAAFDLIVGTSTGGIIACALAAGMPLAGDRGALHAARSGDLFRPLPARSRRCVFRSPEAAAGACRRNGACGRRLTSKLGTKTLGQIYTERGIALAIPAVEMSQHRAWVFKTPHLQRHQPPGRQLHARRCVPRDVGSADLPFAGGGCASRSRARAASTCSSMAASGRTIRCWSA